MPYHHSIAIIATSADIRSNFAQPLRGAGFHVVEASSGLDGLRIAEEQFPVIVFLEQHLSGMSSAEVCRRLKTPLRTTPPFVLLLSTQADLAQENQEIDDYADGYILQTASPREFVARARSIFRLKRSESLLKEIFESSPNAIVVSDLQGVIIECNHSALELYGAASKDEVIGQRGWQFIAQDEAQGTPSYLSQLLETGCVNNIEYRLIKKDGAPFFGEISASVMTDPTGVPVGVISIIRDATGRKQAEQAVRESEERYRILFENSPISLWEVDISRVKCFFDEISTRETPDLEQYFSEHPEKIRQGIEMIQVCNLNQATLRLFEAKRKEDLHHKFWLIWTEEVSAALTKQALVLWRGAKEFTLETTNMTCAGNLLYIRITMALAPGYEDSWARALVTVIDLTERKQIEDALARERYLLRMLMEHSPYLIYFKDRESRFIRVNNAVLRRLSSAGKTQLLGATDADFFSPEHAEQALADERRIMTTREPLIDLEEREVWLNGRITWVSTTKLPFYDEQGNVIGTFGISREITGRKDAEQHEHLTTQILDMLNRSDESINIIREILLLVKDFTGFEKIGIRLKNGKDFPYYETIGFPSEFIETARDVCPHDAQRKIVCDESGNSILECLCGNVLCGRTDPALPFFTTAGSFWTNSLSALFASTTDAEWQARMRNRCSGEGYESVALIPLRSGQRIIGLLQMNDHRAGMFLPERIRFFEGLGASIGIALDHRRAEEEMTRLRNFMKNMIDSMPSILLGIDLEGRITHWNLEAEKVTKRSAQDVQGQLLHDVFPEFTPFLEKVREAILQQTPFKEEKVSNMVQGESHYFNIMVYPLVSDGVEGAVIRIDDVTEQVQMEEIMVQSEKMASLGNLAAGMAHELNNPIAGILQNTQVLLTRLTRHFPANTIAALEAGTNMDAIREFMLKRDIIKMLELIRNSGERAGEIVKDMLSFSRKRSSQAALNDVHELIEKAVEFASHAYNIKFACPLKNFRIIREFDAALPKIRCEGAQIQQVMLNLLINAAQAAAEYEHRQEEPTIILRTKRDGDMARIEVEDNGPGMPEQVRKRVFEPFFTTKDVGIGTGLGLSVSYFIITEHHNGTMSVESEPRKGCRFIITLPIGVEESLSHSWQI